MALLAAGSSLVGVALGASGGTPAAEFSISQTVSRVHLINGRNVVADQRTIGLSVSTTDNLQEFQQIDVSWTGAHPTGRATGNVSDSGSSQNPYPFVLLECRGVENPDPAQHQERLNPTTCWTGGLAQYISNGTVPAFPPWRLDRYAEATNRQAFIGRPAQIPASCGGALDPGRDASEYWLHFVAVGGVDYPGGPTPVSPQGKCVGAPPESGGVLPPNLAFASTGADGSGSAKFNVWTAENDASLGCSSTVPCALVAVPVEGISCDPTAQGLPPADRPPATDQTNAAADCMGDKAAAGDYWWSASNWRNHITVPLSFAPASNLCDVVNSKAEAFVYGSELMTEATTQWAPHFCLDPNLFKFKHVQFSDTQSRNLLGTGQVSATFSSGVPTGGFSAPTVNAPVAFTGFAISYNIDDAQGHSVTNLRITPRLLAKLLTESYLVSLRGTGPPNPNPLNMAADPEFMALNPGIARVQTDAYAPAALLALSSDSDVMYALTSYLVNDPETKAWLGGTPDPWGMTVNPHYTLSALAAIGVTLPAYNWPLLDTYKAFTATANDNSSCVNVQAQAPLLPTVEAPVGHLGPIASDVEFANDRAQVQCSTPDGQQFFPAAQGFQFVGVRFRVGVTSLGEAHRFDLNTAALQTQVTPAAANAKFTNGDGRTFVSPSDESLHAAAKLLTRDASTRTWPIPYQTIETSANAASAYPGTMVVYQQVPTTGLPAADAANYATLLRFITGPGQTPGRSVGQLPPGYLPLIAANDLGSMALYAASAADAVAAQKGGLGELTDTTTPHPAGTPTQTASSTTPSSSTPGSAPGSGPGSSGGGGSSTGGGLAALGSGSSSGSSTSNPLNPGQTGGAGSTPVAIGGAKSPVAAVTAGTTAAFLSRFSGSVFGSLILVALGGVLLASFVYAFERFGPTRRLR